jgi:hypothetical protein
MMKHYRFLTTIMFLTMSIGVWAQETVVKGRVTDASDGSGLPGVNILEKGTSKGPPWSSPSWALNRRRYP